MSQDHTDELLSLNSRIKDEVREHYAASWIEDGALHVAVTSDAAAGKVAATGALPHRAPFTEEALKEALDRVLAWTRSPGGPEVHLHRALLDGREGGVVLHVPPEEAPDLQEAARRDDPGRGVPVQVRASAGLARPYPRKSP